MKNLSKMTGSQIQEELKSERAYTAVLLTIYLGSMSDEDKKAYHDSKKEVEAMEEYLLTEEDMFSGLSAKTPIMDEYYREIETL